MEPATSDSAPDPAGAPLPEAAPAPARQRLWLAVLGTALMLGILVFQRLSLVRRASRPLQAPSTALLPPAGPRPAPAATAQHFPPAPEMDEGNRDGGARKAGTAADRSRT